ncbi:MAG: ECF transporter S component [Clostridia bacterium]|nr:ECF transporter S component [Clostridia bacterium]
MKKGFFSARNITGLAVLTALVVVLQMFGGYFKIGTTSLSFVLVPIVLGGVLYGAFAGAFLGFVFGLVVWLYGVTGADAFTAILFNDHPLITTLLCFGKGIFAGLLGGLTYSLLKRKNEYVGLLTAAAITPIVNTGLFILGALLMSDSLKANFVADGDTVVYFLVIGCAGINFLVELAINLIFAPALSRVIGVVRKGR